MHRSDINKISSKPKTDKFIVLDLDETLVHTNAEDTIETLIESGIYENPDLLDLKRRAYHITMDDVLSKRGEGIKAEMWGVIRPHVKEFLIFCFNYFKGVIVWSAGRKNYVYAIVDYLFKDIKRPLVVFTFDDLEVLSDRKTFIKPLQKLIDTVPGLKDHMSLDNSFILDDRSSVFLKPNPDNGVKIPPYKCDFNNIESMRADDISLKQFMNWLDKPEVITSKNVRQLDKSNIFNTPLNS